MSLAISQMALNSEVIDPEKHDRLIQEIESVARRANIPVQMVWTSMTKYCTEDEIDYVRELRRKRAEGNLGLAYVGMPSTGVPVIERMSAAAAACIRNKINAQVATVTDVIRETQQGTMATPTVLMIPNFYTGKQADIPKWRSGVLLDFLYARKQENLQTFLYIQSMAGLGTDYGHSFVEHLNAFTQIAA